jgi:hypothetical protein
MRRSVLTYSQQLEARARRWRGTAGPGWPRTESFPQRTLRRIRQPDLLHRLRETIVARRRDDPAARWRCCAHWQRTLGQKWNAREFAARHGARVPALYWHGRRVGALPFDALPDHYVVRHPYASSRHGTFVIAAGRDLLRDVVHTRATLRRALRETHRDRLIRPMLVEEFVRTEGGEYMLPHGYHCYVFGGTIAAIELVERRTGVEGTVAYYTPDWTRMADPINVLHAPGNDVPPPACLPELLVTATRLGAAYAIPVRVDLYATDRGCVFGEFSNRPHSGRGFTPYAERYFGELWAAADPSAR